MRMEMRIFRVVFKEKNKKLMSWWVVLWNKWVESSHTREQDERPFTHNTMQDKSIEISLNYKCLPAYLPWQELKLLLLKRKPDEEPNSKQLPILYLSILCWSGQKEIPRKRETELKRNWEIVDLWFRCDFSGEIFLSVESSVCLPGSYQFNSREEGNLNNSLTMPFGNTLYISPSYK